MRDKLRKRIALSAVTALTLFVAVPVYADTYDAVYDDAALLSDEEQQSLSEEITNLQETTGWEIFVLTTEDAQGKTAREYADDFYDTTATGDDGVVFLIDMDNREVTISTAGEAIYYLNDDRIDDILDNCYDYVVDGVVRAPSEFAMTTGSPPSMTATQLFVVPRSIPMILLINEVSSQKNLFISCLDVKRMSIFKTPAGLCGSTRPPRRSRGGRSCRPACSLSGTP